MSAGETPTRRSKLARLLRRRRPAVVRGLQLLGVGIQGVYYAIRVYGELG